MSTWGRLREARGTGSARTVLLWVPVLLLLMLPGTFVLLPAGAWLWRKWKGVPPPPGAPTVPPSTAS